MQVAGVPRALHFGEAAVLILDSAGGLSTMESMREHFVSISAGAVLLAFGYLFSPPLVHKCVGDLAWQRDMRMVRTIYAPLVVLERRAPVYRDALRLEGRLI